MTKPLTDWIGSTETALETLGPTPYAALAATLDRDATPPLPGTPLPALWHWIYTVPIHRRSELAHDGHQKRGDFLPPVTLPRRMWAGGQFTFHAPLRVGDPIKRVSTVESVSAKSGRSGALVFVRVRHEIHAADRLAITEHQDIAYREAAKPGAPAPAPQPAPTDYGFEKTWAPDDVLLFRYSALTFNAHRIHFDRHYVTAEEGYPGLLVHGPLIATLLTDLLRSHRPDAMLARFEFRAMRPLFDIHPFRVRGIETAPRAFRLWAADHEGALAMEASATLQP